MARQGVVQSGIIDRAVLLFYSAAVALCFLLVASTCSPLYAFNDWADANTYLTMGKGMMHGLVPYHDLFEQKGPLIFLLHGLAYLIDRTGFTGVFLFEILSLTATLYLAGRMVALFLARRWQWFILPVLAFLPLASSCFEGGDSVEEFSWPLVMLLLYQALRYFKTQYPAPPTAGWLAVSGFTAGCVFMTKYTLLGYWIGTMALLLGAGLARREFRSLFRGAGAFLAGCVAALLPWLIYFQCNQALDDFFYVYFKVNIGLYGENPSIISRLAYIGLTVTLCALIYWIISLPAVLGIVSFAGRRHLTGRNPGRLLLLICGICIAGTTFWGSHAFFYYCLAFVPLAVPGLITMAAALEKPLARLAARFSGFRAGRNGENHPAGAVHADDGKKRSRRLAAATGLGAAALSLVLLVVLYAVCPNTVLLAKPASAYPQRVFAPLVEAVPGATLLNYGTLDVGLATTTGIVPSTKYFMLNNISDARFPAMRAEQARYIHDKRVTFVVVRWDRHTSAGALGIPGLLENYRLVAAMEATYRVGIDRFRYELYQVR
jgi:hypothetical protein